MLPLVLTATLQSALLTLLSTIIAKTFTASDPPIIPMVIFALINTPPNYYWQLYLEKKLPGYTTKKVEVDDGGKGVGAERKLNMRNTLLKFALDQTIAALWNVGLYLGVVRLLQGLPVEKCWRAVKVVCNIGYWAGTL